MSIGDPELEHRVKIPSDWADWLGVSFRGQVAYTRRFNRPTGLEAEQRVWLVIEAIDFRGSVLLNDQPIGCLQFGDPPLRIEIGSWIQKSNRIRIDIELPIQVDRGDRNQMAGGLIGGVRLEIEEPLNSNNAV